MPDIKLAKLPERTPVKLAIQIPHDLSEALLGYAKAYEAAYGVAEPVAELIPAMLRAFIESDRSFRTPGWDVIRGSHRVSTSRPGAARLSPKTGRDTAKPLAASGP